MTQNKTEVVEEIVIIEIIEIEVHCKTGEPTPHAKKYRIRIDKLHYEVDVHQMTGRQLLELSKHEPPENFSIYQKFHKGSQKKIALDEEVDFRSHGLERFMTLPLDQTEGAL